MPRSTTPARPRRLGRFLLQEELGRGGMGVVHAALDEEQGRRVALKLLRASAPGGDDAATERFEREMRVAITLEHPNVVPVYATGTEDGVRYIAMRLVGGEDLGTVLRRDAPLEPLRVARIARQLGAALDAAHALDLVHRDVKPGNVLLTGAGDEEHVYLTDFGLAREPDGGVTQTGQWVGTVDYAAPEQIEAGAIGPRTDVYALACLLFHALTGRLPYTGTFAAKATAHVTAPLPSIGPDVTADPARLDAVLATATAKDPGRRQASAGALARAFARAVEDAVDPVGQRTAPFVPLPADGPDGAPTAVAPVAGGSGPDAPRTEATAVADVAAPIGSPTVGTEVADVAAPAGSPTVVTDAVAQAASPTAATAAVPRRRALAGPGRPRPRAEVATAVTAAGAGAAADTAPPTGRHEPRRPGPATPTASGQPDRDLPARRWVAALLLGCLVLGVVIAVATGGDDGDRSRAASATSSTGAAQTAGSGSATTSSQTASATTPAPIVPLATTDYTAPQGGYTTKIPAAAGWTAGPEQNLGGVLRTVVSGPDGQQLWIDATPTMAPTFGRTGRTITQARTLQSDLGPVAGYRFTGAPSELCAGGCVDYQVDLGGRGFAVLAGPTPQTRLAARTAILALTPTAAARPPVTGGGGPGRGADGRSARPGLRAPGIPAGVPVPPGLRKKAEKLMRKYYEGRG